MKNGRAHWALVAAGVAVSLLVAGCGGGHGPVVANILFAFAGFNGTDWDIYIQRSSGLETLVTGAGDQVHPSLSWDRQTCAYEDRASGSGQIVLVRTATGGLVWRRVSINDDSDPELSPDGSMVVFVTRTDGSADIWVCGVRGGDSHRLTDWPGNEVDPTWSADGRAIYFAADRDGTYDIWRIELTGAGLTKITRDNTADERYPTMRSSAEEIVFASNADGDWELFHRDARRVNDPATRVTNNTTDDIEPSWYRRGNQNEVLYTTNAGGGWHLRRQMVDPLQAPVDVALPVPARHPAF